jgi:FkbM family methyltransferase
MMGELQASNGVRWRDIALIAYGRAFEHPSKVRIVRWLIRRLAAGRIRVRHAPGAMIAIDPADYIGWAVFKTGYYEPASLNLALLIMAREPGLFVDVGANFGWYTCAIGAVVGVTVISIEPDCENCALLRGNTAQNKLQNVLVFNGAVGRKFETVQMIRRVRANKGAIAIRSDDEAADPHGDWVATVPLETLLRQFVDPPARPVLIKIDVEGSERDVLEGLDFDGPFRPKNILMEFDPELAKRAWGSLGNLQAFFAAKGYELLDVFGRQLGNRDEVPEANVWAQERKSG